MDGMSPNPIIITGPTGSGKSDLAIKIAKELSGEIISVDSMQVYKGMDVGTAKVSKKEQMTVPHHMIDICSVVEEFDVAKFIDKASKLYQEIFERGRVPIFCGGTGLYLKAFFQGIGTAPPKDAEIRKNLEKLTLEELQIILKSEAPSTFNYIDKDNPRRLIRAIEIVRLTGRPPKDLKSPWDQNISNWPKCVYVIQPELEDHLKKMEQRVDKMLENGLVEETSRLIDEGILQNHSAAQAIGYRQIISYLQGDTELQDAVESIKIKTRQFAKRQRTWFRNQMPPSQILPSSDPLEAKNFILNHYQGKQPGMTTRGG